MPPKYDQTIDQLVAGIKPVKTILPGAVRLGLWSAISYSLVLIQLALTGGIRNGWFTQLWQHPQFLLEFAVGLVVSPLAAWMAIKLSVPDENNLVDWRRWLAPAGFVVLAGLAVVSVFSPALEPSMAGKRPHCVWEVLAFGILPAVLLTAMVRQAAPLMFGWNGFLIGLAAFTPAAVAMHVTCMYDPVHVLAFHLAPAVLMTVVTTLICLRVLRQ